MWTSIPLLMLSGVSYPREGIPDWLFNFGQLFPSSHGVDGFIRIQSMGASLGEVLPEIRIGREQRERLAQRMNDKEEY